MRRDTQTERQKDKQTETQKDKQAFGFERLDRLDRFNRFNRLDVYACIYIYISISID